MTKSTRRSEASLSQSACSFVHFQSLNILTHANAQYLQPYIRSNRFVNFVSRQEGKSDSPLKALGQTEGDSFELGSLLWYRRVYAVCHLQCNLPDSGWGWVG